MSFDRIQIGRVTGQPLEDDVVAAFGEKLLRRRTMSRQPIENYLDRSPQFVSQASENPNHVFGANVFLLDVESQVEASALGRNADRCENGKSVIAIPTALYGRSSSQRPSATPNRLQTEAGFIKKYQTRAATASFFDSRPILFPPTDDRRLVPFASELLGLLRREAEVVQDASQVIGMIRHAEILEHDVGHATTRPKISGVARRERTEHEDLDEFGLLSVVELGRFSGRRLSGQGGFTARGQRTLPCFDAAQADPEQLCDFR